MTEIDQYGRIKNRNFQTQSVSSFPSFNDDDGNVWQRTNNYISNIGEWISSNTDSLCTNISIGIYILCWIVFGIAVIATLINKGLVSAIIGGIIGGVIVYYGAVIITFIALLILKIIMRILRLLFYNIYTFIIGIGLNILLLFVYN